MSRFEAGTSEENQPVTWWRGYPLYAAHFLVVVFVASMLVTTLLMFGRVSGVLEALSFSSASVLQGQVWRILTYGFVNPPSVGFALDMVMIVWFGREVERYLGRRVFFQLYAGIYLVKPLLLTALGPFLTTRFAGEVGSFALFVAFATLFPNAPLLFNILAKWAALVLVAISALMALAVHDWAGLLELAATCGFAYAFVRFQQGNLRLPLPRIRIRPRQPEGAPRPATVAAPVPRPGATRPTPAAPAAPRPAAGTMAEVDALLDKIAQHGIHSLTTEERARLESARAEMLKRGGGR